MAKKKKTSKVQFTLWDVLLSFPNLHKPKPYKGNVYYKTDVLLDPDHSQLDDLRAAILGVKTSTWGDDKAEWPEGATNVGIKSGKEREDQAAYKGKKYITLSKNAEYGTPSVIDLKGKEFNPAAVKGGMYANVTFTIAPWKPDESTGESEGLSLFLDGVQIDTSKQALNFGGGGSIQDRFKRKGKDKDSEDDQDDEDEEPKKKRVVDEDEDDEPRGKKKRAVDEDDEDAPPKRNKKGFAKRDQEEE